MARLVIFLLLALSFSAAGVWLADHPGHAIFTWENYHVETSLSLIAFCAMLLAAMIYVFFAFLTFLSRVPTRFRRRSRYHRQQQGLDALTHAFIAMTASDTITARRMLAKADKLIERPTITHLLSSQLARIEGDETAATKHLEAMLEHKESTWIALQGLSDSAMKRGDYTSALSHAERARMLRPRDEWVQNTLINLYCREERWNDAASIVRRLRKSKKEKARLHAIINYLQATSLLRDGDSERALRMAEKTFKADFGFTPGSVFYAQLLADSGKREKAMTVLTRAWQTNPHPDLFTAFVKIDTDDIPEKFLKRITKLYALQPEHVESHLALAQAYLRDGQWEQSRNHLRQAVEQANMQRIYPLLAKLEEQSTGDTPAAKEWLKKGDTAPVNPMWTCYNCHSLPPAWYAYCPHCSSFNSLEWKQNLPHYVPAN